ncbi:hypothetical protein SAMN05216296_1990 [Pseudomonas pohangensis]|uniref:Uncharacterized protein n=1 Tax=Pseudomonas pohangensis TaxID=364197 RepID=A0A1H2G2F3_9PSED|nr:hypothetical protein [Pseudomonas pohangensis]SDU13803.1 hypothetical protein SAMN05216296_1990 [Pseudomonas pohangensis]
MSDQTIGNHFSTSEREALIRLCESREAVASFLWSSGSDCREKSRLEDAMEQLLDLIKYE